MQQKPLYQNPILKGNLRKLSLGEQVPEIPEMSQEEAMKKGFDINVSAVLPFDPGSLQPLTYEQAVGMSANKMAKSPAMLKAIDEAMKKGPTKLDPQADMPAVLGPKLLGAFNPAEQYEGDDPLVKGYLGSDFYERMSTTNVVPYTYQGKEMSGSGSYASNFKKYLESIGKGDLIQFPDQEIAQQGSGSLATIGGSTPPPGSGTPMDPIGVGQDIFGNNPAEIAVPSTPNPIQGVGLDGAPINSYNRVGQQLMGPNQDDILGTLKNIEQGIASLGQGGMNQSSFGGFNNNFGIGSFFPPYGGMYG